MQIRATTISFCALKLASLYKISFIVGSCMAFFSATAVAMPLIGAFGGSFTAISTLLCGYLFKGLLGGGWAVTYLLTYLPGLCAALAWHRNNVLVRVLLPITAIFLFVMHPVGSSAAPYCLYWLIPIFIYLSRSSRVILRSKIVSRDLFFNALSVTFIAHAVGSIIWLYTVPMTSTMWLSLIPVVAVERLLFATSIAFVYQLVTIASRLQHVPCPRMIFSKGSR